MLLHYPKISKTANLMKKHLLPLAILAGSSLVSLARADTFGTGINQFTLDFTTIGNVGQGADSRGYIPPYGQGKVPYSFAMGTYAISQNQLAAAVSASGQDFGGGAWSGNQPAANVSWYQAAAFVNWLNTSTGHQAAYNLTYSGGAYTMALWQTGQAGYDSSNRFRNSLALYVLPSDDEYYKAAFGKSDGSGYFSYATETGIVPTAVASGTNAGTAVFNNITAVPASVFQAGGLSSYGTMGQMGNVLQWQESLYAGLNNYPADDRYVAGASYYSRGAIGVLYDVSGRSSPTNTYGHVGFRVAEITGNAVSSNAVPEPSTTACAALGLVALVIVYRRRLSL